MYGLWRSNALKAYSIYLASHFQPYYKFLFFIFVFVRHYRWDVMRVHTDSQAVVLVVFVFCFLFDVSFITFTQTMFFNGVHIYRALKMKKKKKEEKRIAEYETFRRRLNKIFNVFVFTTDCNCFVYYYILRGKYLESGNLIFSFLKLRTTSCYLWIQFSYFYWFRLCLT